jgi:dGTPase
MARSDRFHDHKKTGSRSEFQRDRDRILYSSALRRLAGVTQVVLPGGEPYLFHNRLTHSMKVAQVGRRIAEALVDAGGVDDHACNPDVVEAACLAHDLGHPPFGHIAEWELNRCVKADCADSVGFEGNAQSFRILTRLARIRTETPGLNLTRATLAATTKYPWYMGQGPMELPDKWGAYAEDSEAFDWMLAEAGGKTLEAEVMDWADDITYAVHDVEDFYRAGFIPLDRFVTQAESLDPIYQEVKDKWLSHLSPDPPTDEELTGLNPHLLEFPLRKPFTGTRSERSRLRAFTSALVNTLVTGTHLDGQELRPDRGPLLLVAVLKALTKRFVIKSPLLGTQQHGQRRIVRTLYETYRDALTSKDAVELVPQRWSEEAAEVAGGDEKLRARCSADIVASMTEEEALRTHHRLTGISPGSFLDPVIG